MSLFNINIHAEYSKLFGKKAPSLKHLIPNRVSVGCLIAHSMISYSDRTEYLNTWCEKNLNLSKKGKKEIKRVKIKKRPSNLLLWVELLKKDIKSCDLNKFKVDNFLKEVVEPLTAINEKEVPDKDEPLYLVKNILYAYQDNALYQFYRAIQIFINDKSMRVYAEDFENKNEIALKEFIFICHCIGIKYLKNADFGVAQKWVLSAEELSLSTGFMVDKIEKTMKLISFTQAECRKYSQSEEFKEHDFNFFANKPFFKIDNNYYVPVDGKLTQNLVFNNLFYRVKSASKNKKAFMRDFGFAFERYVVSFIEDVCLNSRSHKYIHVPEFKYDNQTKHSSDSYILYQDSENEENIVLVVEVKSARILDNVKRLKGSRDAVEKSIKKLSLSPLEQQIKVTSNIIKSNSHQSITENAVYYFISVSMDDFPLLVGGWDSKINSGELNELKCGGLYSFNIEELELLSKLISGDLEYPFPYLLEKYRVDYSELSFKTYLSRLEKALGFKNPRFEKKILESQKIITDYLRSENV